MTKSATIYHYTTISGLIGILSKRQLWASDCRFLNDGSELSYARDIFFEEVSKLNLPPLEGGGYRIPGYSIDFFGMFITCFCENGDLLSQWRGYGVDQGYSLGFNVADLKELKVDGISPVQYGISNPKEFFEQELDYAPHPTAHPGVEGFYATQQLLPRLALVKHPGFAEEKEWRLLKLVSFYEMEGTDTEVFFRQSTMGAIGYIVIPFPIKCLREIIIGPGAYTESREAAVQTMLVCNNLSDVEVSISNVPFRR